MNKNKITKIGILSLIIILLLVLPVSAGWITETLGFITEKITGGAVAGSSAPSLISPIDSNLKIALATVQPESVTSTDITNPSDTVTNWMKQPAQALLNQLDGIIASLENELNEKEKKVQKLESECVEEPDAPLEWAGPQDKEVTSAPSQKEVGLLGRIFNFGGSNEATITKETADREIGKWNSMDLPFATDVRIRSDALEMKPYVTSTGQEMLVVVYLAKDNSIKMASCQSNLDCLLQKSWTQPQKLAFKELPLPKSASGIGIYSRENGGMMLAYVESAEMIREAYCKDNCHLVNSWKDIKTYPVDRQAYTNSGYKDVSFKLLRPSFASLGESSSGKERIWLFYTLNFGDEVPGKLGYTYYDDGFHTQFIERMGRSLYFAHRNFATSAVTRDNQIYLMNLGYTKVLEKDSKFNKLNSLGPFTNTFVLNGKVAGGNSITVQDGTLYTPLFQGTTLNIRECTRDCNKKTGDSYSAWKTHSTILTAGSTDANTIKNGRQIEPVITTYKDLLYLIYYDFRDNKLKLAEFDEGLDID